MSRRGVTLTEVLVLAVVVGIVLAILIPGMLALRERSRRTACVSNLERIGSALRQYHETYASLPPAAVWRPGPLQTVMLNEVKQIDLITHENWAQLLLPFLGQEQLAHRFDRDAPLLMEANDDPRMERPREFVCPADEWNSEDNPFVFGWTEAADEPGEETDRGTGAASGRGNYAINGGSHNHRYRTESPGQPRFDGLELVLGENPQRFELIGTGVAGINHAFPIDAFQNGQSTLVAVEEVRAGVHPLDPRGVWALGQVGGSITWAHGVSGDACGPNNLWERSDDLLGCGRLHEAVGKEFLAEQRMPCVHYVDRNDQAGARSQHPKGVNVLFLDGAVRFVSDDVDKGLWHVMHSRETPAGLLTSAIETRLGAYDPPAEASRAAPHAPSEALVPGETMTNSIGMALAVLPAGEFLMGIPDEENAAPPPPECPVHKVRISAPFLIGSREVTQEEFRTVMGSNPSFHGQSDLDSPDLDSPDLDSPDQDDFPVENVTWEEAREFCLRLSDLESERTAGRRYRLPTEAEWEYACRGGKSEPFQWTSVRLPDDDGGANVAVLPVLPVAKVGSYRANEFGLYDMRGNVWEWCSDWFDRSYYLRSPAVDPQGPSAGYLKVVRGGDWTFVGEPCRINYPMTPPWKRSRYVGFRVACDVTADAAPAVASPLTAGSLSSPAGTSTE